MTRMKRSAAVIALGSAVALFATACVGQTGSGDDTNENADAQTITWWHNSNTGEGKEYYDQVAKDFEEETGVEVKVNAMQHQDMLTKLQAAFQGGDSEQIPDVYMSRGGGELQAEIDAGLVRDITEDASETIDKLDPSFTTHYTVDEKVYALPYSIGLVGFWYNADLFADAGIDEVSPSPTIEEFYGYIDKLDKAGITPLSVGAKDLWPAAHYWYYGVVRECPFETVEDAIANKDYSDPCFVKAGEHVEDIIAKKPFNKGFLSTGAQDGPTSATGLLATEKVAMELAGHWEPGTAGGLTEDGQVPEFLDWFAFPTFEGQGGDPVDQMGGGDAWSVSSGAPDAAVDFANYLLSDDVQVGFAELDMGLPTNPAATDKLSDDALQGLVDVRDSGGQTQLYLDTRLGQSIGGAMNDAIGLMFAGEAGPQDVVDAVQSAAEKG